MLYRYVYDRDMTNLAPGTCCQACGLLVPFPPKLRAGKNHPETSHAAAAASNKLMPERRAEIYRRLHEAGAAGLTDDEMDILTAWGHASTSGLMSTLRKERRFAMLRDKEGKLCRKRLTRRGKQAGVNILGPYMPPAPDPEPPKPKSKRRKRTPTP